MKLTHTLLTALLLVPVGALNAKEAARWVLPDGTVVATTYANYRQQDVGCSIVSIRFKLSEIDALADASTPAAR